MGCVCMLVQALGLWLLVEVCVGVEVQRRVWCNGIPSWVGVSHVPLPWCDKGFMCVWAMGSVGLKSLVVARSVVGVTGRDGCTVCAGLVMSLCLGCRVLLVAGGWCGGGGFWIG